MIIVPPIFERNALEGKKSFQSIQSLSISFFPQFDWVFGLICDFAMNSYRDTVRWLKIIKRKTPNYYIIRILENYPQLSSYHGFY